MRAYFILSSSLMALLAAGLLTGCAAVRNDLDSGIDYGNDKEILTRKTDKRPEQRRPAINAYMWRAALGAVQAYPVTLSDPAAGVIITDWYSSPQNANERQKIRIDVMGADVRRDMVRVTVTRHLREGQEGRWKDAPVQATIAQSIENDILFTARDIRGW